MLIKRLLPNVVETHPFGLYTYKRERPTINKINKKFSSEINMRTFTMCTIYPGKK